MKWLTIFIALSLALAVPFAMQSDDVQPTPLGTDSGSLGAEATSSSNEPVFVKTEYGTIPVYASEPESAPEGPYAVASGEPEPLVMPIAPGTPMPASHSDPLPIELYAGHLGPGTPIIINGGSICTANWLWKDHEGTLYLGSAGHCFLGSGDLAGSNSPGGAADLSTVSVQACIDLCFFGGYSSGLVQEITGTIIDLGPVKYARQATAAGGTVGYDFGLVEIPALYQSVATPQMLVIQEGFGGPVSQDNSVDEGEIVYLHGHGTWHGETFVTQNRPGVGRESTATEWSAVLSVSGGDSGSALGSYDPVTSPEDLHAAGIVTHSTTIGAVAGADIPLAGGFGLGLGFGTVMSQAVNMVGEIGLCIAPLMESDDPVTSTPPAQDLSICPDGDETASSLNITSPIPGGIAPDGINTVTGDLTQIVQPGPLVVSAGGPYAGDINSAIPIAAIISGGLAPYTCDWSTDAGLTVASNSCITTAMGVASDSHLLVLTVTDALGGNAADSTTVTVTNPALVCVADPALDAAPDYDILGVCLERQGSQIVTTIQLDIMVIDTLLLNADSPVLFNLYFPGVPRLEVYNFLGSGLFNTDAGVNVPATITYDTAAATLTVAIGEGTLLGLGLSGPPVVSVDTAIGEGLAGAIFPMDVAPDSGTIGPVSAPSSPVSNHPSKYPAGGAGTDRVELYFDGVYVGNTTVDLTTFPVPWTLDVPLMFSGQTGELHAQWFMADGTFIASDTHILERMTPIQAFAGGPYDGVEDKPTPISGSATGGPMDPMKCTWTGTDASFANSNSCATTVTFENPGDYEITFTAKKGAFSATETAQIHVELDADAIAVGDADGDGVKDDVDNCSDISNKDQSDIDGDGLGDACDPDDDGDGKNDNVDNCPGNSNPGQADLDGDGEGDACDNDWDGDGWLNGSDGCPIDADPRQTDQDRDGIGDACDSDRDGDGVPNAEDAYPDDKSNWSDVDLDGLPDQTVDLDDDGDGILDSLEASEGTQSLDPNSRPDGDAGIDEAPSKDSPGLPLMSLLAGLAAVAIRRR